MATKNAPKFVIKTDAKANGSEPTFEVIEKMFEIGKRGKNVVRLDYGAWNGNDPKYELRIWKEKDGELQPTKGIGLSGEELIALKNALNEMEEE